MTHAFHELVVSGRPEAKIALEYWAKHDYYVSRSFPSLVALLISTMPDFELRSTLVRNLWDECGYGHLEKSHFKNYEHLLASIDVLPAEVPCEPVVDFIEMQRSLSLADPVVAAAVFCYANEYLCLFEFKSIERGLKHFFPEVNLQYIMQIDTIDERHAEELEDALSAHCPEDRLPAIVRHLSDTLEVRALLYDLAVASGLESRTA